MIKIAEILSTGRNTLWDQVKQIGVDHVVTSMPPAVGNEKGWEYMPMLRMKNNFNDAGFDVAVIESTPPMHRIKLGTEGREEELDNVCTFIESMGRVGIKTWCYNWMAILNWTRTSSTVPSRGGAVVTGYDHAMMKNAPLTEAGEVSEDQLWETLHEFLERVTPVAEQYGVEMAMHPDDPPLSPLRGIGRIMRSVDNFQKLLDLVPSPMNGVTFCQGNFALMTGDQPAAIRHFGAQRKIFFVHFRDVRGDVENYVETFHDDGPTDMMECLRAYRDIGFEGVLRPDHVPTLSGEDNDHPGYSALCRLYAVGYIRGLREAVYREDG
ncbi:MAG: TIM barrel protein [Gemmatimonadetes bacterium]|nr:TIM barrel protein [Gemmatimonadota bacterium]MYD25654.1 TIM barrel protein [Gemmatimonadota bacterium]